MTFTIAKRTTSTVIKTFARTASAACVASVIGFTMLATPAQAGGQISFGFAPANAKQEQAMKIGLLFYGLAESLSNNGGIVQNGTGNGAGIVQNGNGNFGVVHQEGNGHNGAVHQAGNNNTCGLFQFGQNTSGQCLQTGGQTGTTFQFGW